MADLEVEFRGPVFSPFADNVINAATRQIEQDVARETHRRVRLLETAFFRHPTGNYRAHTLMRARAGYHEVTDSGVIYGPWLEGIGSRNRTTRFKGYFFWRKTLQSMQRSGALAIAQPTVDRLVRALNG
jgi:hypothetical protein